jgi:hypothetical protein
MAMMRHAFAQQGGAVCTRAIFLKCDMIATDYPTIISAMKSRMIA